MRYIKRYEGLDEWGVYENDTCFLQNFHPNTVIHMDLKDEIKEILLKEFNDFNLNDHDKEIYINNAIAGIETTIYKHNENSPLNLKIKDYMIEIEEEFKTYGNIEIEAIFEEIKEYTVEDLKEKELYYENNKIELLAYYTERHNNIINMIDVNLNNELITLPIEAITIK